MCRRGSTPQDPSAANTATQRQRQHGAVGQLRADGGKRIAAGVAGQRRQHGGLGGRHETVQCHPYRLSGLATQQALRSAVAKTHPVARIQQQQDLVDPIQRGTELGIRGGRSMARQQGHEPILGRWIGPLALDKAGAQRAKPAVRVRAQPGPA